MLLSIGYSTMSLLRLLRAGGPQAADQEQPWSAPGGQSSALTLPRPRGGGVPGPSRYSGVERSGRVVTIM